MPSRNSKHTLTDEQQAQLAALRYQVKRFEDKGLMNTAAHEALTRLETELGLIPARKTEVQKDEVNDGKSNI